MAKRVALRANSGFLRRYHSTAIINGRKLATFAITNVTGLWSRHAAINGFCSVACPIDTRASVLSISARQINDNMMLSMLTTLAMLFISADLHSMSSINSRFKNRTGRLCSNTSFSTLDIL